MSDEEHSEEEEEEEERSEIEAGTEEADPDRQDKEKAIDKYNLKNYSEDFMRQVVDFPDETNRFGKRSHTWKSIRHRFKAVPDQKYISRFRRYLEYHGTKRQKTQNVDELVYKNLATAREKGLLVHDLDIQKWATKIAKELKVDNFHASLDAKCLLLSDSYPGRCHAKTYEPKNCGGKQVTGLQIPQNTTDQLQPLDCYFNRQIKKFLKACYNRVALDELDIHLHQRNNIIRLGKSSVLEALSGIQLPRADYICTRCPLELRLKRLNDLKQKEYAAIRSVNGQDKELKSLDDISNEVIQITNVVAGKQQNISPKPIILTVYKHNSLDLTLIDLPRKQTNNSFIEKE
ncbi:unnamed protein product [Didymodactylos carnosus]|uniref:Dynamin GTPase domain-containing protein n=1 Tax=Didymodactylos carnosus TaxID=1234261 RepID=A0A815QG50_9BILA|nr:unnamed protein product [Didymodactylos carnosus]CAF4332697.1 unnamed protein product [Didymodactylos carnosus]